MKKTEVTYILTLSGIVNSKRIQSTYVDYWLISDEKRITFGQYITEKVKHFQETEGATPSVIHSNIIKS